MAGFPRALATLWHIKGSLALSSGQSSDEAFDRLEPLFRQNGTSHRRSSDTLTFHKRDPDAQDKMSIFDEGVLRIDKSSGGAVLHYCLVSRALLFCLLAPLLFLSFAGATIAVHKFQTPSAETAEKKETKQDAAPQQHPIDKFLGAPAPEKPKKDGKDKEEDKGPSPTSAYVFAAIFAALYLVGRLLEDRLIRGVFKRTLLATRS